MAIAHAERQRALEEKERKRLLKEAAAQEERRRKDEVKRQRERLKRQKEEEKEEAKRQREEVKRQKTAAKEEAKRQREEAKQQKEEMKRQREEGVTTEVGRRSGEREEKRRRTDHTAFIAIPPPPFRQLPIAPTPSTKPRPRPTKRLPPAHGTENLEPRSQFDPPHPVFHSPPMFAQSYPYEMLLQSTPPSPGGIPSSHPLSRAPTGNYPPPPTTPSPWDHPLYPPPYPIPSGPRAGGTERVGPRTTTDL